MSHPMFTEAEFDWRELYDKRMVPPHKPKVCCLWSCVCTRTSNHCVNFSSVLVFFFFFFLFSFFLFFFFCYRFLLFSSSFLFAVGAVRCGAVRCGAVRCGVVWCGASAHESESERARVVCVSSTSRCHDLSCHLL